MSSSVDLCVVGGAGHVGLPLALAFLERGLTVRIVDQDAAALTQLRAGALPFRDPAAEIAFARHKGHLEVTSELASVRDARWILIAVGTTASLTGEPDAGLRALTLAIAAHVRRDQCIILRSTVTPGTTARLQAALSGRAHLAYCPERSREGEALEELTQFPQLIGGCDAEAESSASELFLRLAPRVICLRPEEVELAKTFSNAWRYIQFAASNQLLMTATRLGLDYHKIHAAMTTEYPRAADLPRAGFVGGPCLLQNTLQVTSVDPEPFRLGLSAMEINEGLPAFIVDRLKRLVDLRVATVGLLGMAFKPNSDDTRASMSFRLRDLLAVEARAVLCSDPLVREPGWMDAEELVQRCDVLILATPHEAYEKLAIPPEKTLVDLWNLYGRGVGLI